MLFRKLFKNSAFAGMLAAGLSAMAPAASSGSPEPAASPVEYLPLQNISYEFGSKFMSGYFVRQAAQCLLTLMVIEKSDPDDPLPVTAARIRLILNPDQVAGLDSEEGRSLNVTCGEGAARVLVETGERSELVARQARAASSEVAKMP